MAGEKGRAMVIKVGDGATAETFTTIGGLRTKSFQINNEEVDTTDDDSAGIQELLEGAGVQSVTISGSGVFKNSASEELVRGYAFANSIDNYELYFESGANISGAFQITSLEYTGEYNGARQYSMTLKCSGGATYAAS